MAEPNDLDADTRTPIRQAPLDYAPPAESRPGLHMCLGALATAGVILPVAVIGPLVGGIVGLVLAPLFIIVVAALVAAQLRRSHLTRGWAAGIWVGIGVAVLVDGLCWAVLSGWKFAG